MMSLPSVIPEATERPPRRRGTGWWKFAASFLVAGTIVLLAASLIGLKTATQSIGLVVLLIVLWPVLLTVGLLMFTLIVSLIAQDDAGAGEAVEIGVHAGVWYFSKLATVRSPWFWGSLLGACLTVGGMYYYVRHEIDLKEEATKKQVALLADEIRAFEKRNQRFPEQERLTSGGTWEGHSLVDAWNRPLVYFRIPTETGEYFRIASVGWNGKPELQGGDDIAEEGTAVRGAAVGKTLLKAAKKKLIKMFRKDE